MNTLPGLSPLNRRTALGLLAGGMSAAMLPGCSSEPDPDPGTLDLSAPGDLLTAIAKMRGSTDDRLVMGFVIGNRYAVIENIAMPMWGILAGTFSRYRRISETAFEGKTLEVAYFTDLDTGELLETWENPYTGKLIDVPQTRMGPSTIILTAEGLEIPTPAGEATGMQINHRFLPAVVNGDDVWITEEIQVAGMPPFPGAELFAYNEMSTYHAKMHDLANPDLASVPTSVDFHGLVSWRPWMGFGDIAGHTTARASGKRINRIEDFPKQYLELGEKYHADVLNDPLAVLEG